MTRVALAEFGHTCPVVTLTIRAHHEPSTNTYTAMVLEIASPTYCLVVHGNALRTFFLHWNNIFTLDKTVLMRASIHSIAVLRSLGFHLTCVLDVDVLRYNCSPSQRGRNLSGVDGAVEAAFLSRKNQLLIPRRLRVVPRDMQDMASSYASEMFVAFQAAHDSGSYIDGAYQSLRYLAPLLAAEYHISKDLPENCGFSHELQLYIRDGNSDIEVTDEVLCKAEVLWLVRNIVAAQLSIAQVNKVLEFIEILSNAQFAVLDCSERERMRNYFSSHARSCVRLSAGVIAKALSRGPLEIEALQRSWCATCAQLGHFQAVCIGAPPRENQARRHAAVAQNFI